MNAPKGLAHLFAFFLHPGEPRKHKMPSIQDIMLEGKRWLHRNEHKTWNQVIAKTRFERRLKIKERAHYQRIQLEAQREKMAKHHTS